MDTAHKSPDADQTKRKRVVDLLAKATREELEQAYGSLSPAPLYAALRGPETGLVMVRGRMGGGGAPFNLGEATMSRASIRLENGSIGHGYRLGTDRKAVTMAAVFDALAQDDAMHEDLNRGLLALVEARLAADTERTRSETAATKVDFFTMVRGED